MKRILIAFLLAAGLSSAAHAQDIWMSKNAEISFFSKAPLEDIDAVSKKAASAINTQTHAVYFKVPITSFEFKKKLMQEHFNENYMESDKYPDAEFNGKIADEADLSKDGVYTVTCSGKLTIHGVTKDYSTKGTVAVKNGKMVVNATFKVKIKDHNIEIPKMVTKNIAEVVDVTVNAGYEPRK